MLTPDESAELTRLEAAFEEAGGRGVELAERIDELRAKRASAARGADFEHGEHTVLVAFSVYGDNHKDATEVLASELAYVNLVDDAPVTEWWIAEDDRSDGSDNDSAVFVTPGRQNEASRILAKHGLTPEHNIVER